MTGSFQIAGSMQSGLNSPREKATSQEQCHVKGNILISQKPVALCRPAERKNQKAEAKSLCIMGNFLLALNIF